MVTNDRDESPNLTPPNAFVSKVLAVTSVPREESNHGRERETKAKHLMRRTRSIAPTKSETSQNLKANASTAANMATAKRSVGARPRPNLRHHNTLNM
jgi:hypothetical protein